MKNPRQGFTLVELLVVIAIIGLLIALLLPAVQQVRESGRQTQCRSNLKQIGIALQTYHDSYRAFPPFLVIRSGDPRRLSNLDKGPNWLVMLLPYLEQRAVFENWDPFISASENAGRSVQLKILRCPSDTYNTAGNKCDYAGGGWARGNYGMNVSPCSFNMSSNTTGSLSGFGGLGGPNFSVGFHDIIDGTSNTIAVDELRAGVNNHDPRGCWALPGLASGTGALFDDAHRPNDNGGNSDDIENCAATGQAGDGSRGMGCFNSQSTGQVAARSMHPEGVHVLLADGSARFVSNAIDTKKTMNGCGDPPYGVWQSLHTRANGEITPAY